MAKIISTKEEILALQTIANLAPINSMVNQLATQGLQVDNNRQFFVLGQRSTDNQSGTTMGLIPKFPEISKIPERIKLGEIAVVSGGRITTITVRQRRS